MVTTAGDDGTRESLAAIRRMVESGDLTAGEALERLREAYVPPPDGFDPALPELALVWAAVDKQDEGASLDDVLRRVLAAGELPAARTYTHAEPPVERVLWTGEPSGGDLLGAGEVALLSGGGGLGKSTLALDVALCAVAAERAGLRDAELGCGLRVAAGCVLLATYEDSARRTYPRIRAIADALAMGYTIASDPAEEGPGSQTVVGDPELAEVLREYWIGADIREQPLDRALYAPPAGSAGAAPQPTSAYPALWARAEREQARLLVIDPAAAAFSGAANDASAVRAFVSALAADAERTGIAVLLLAHDTKESRRTAAESGPAERAAAAVSGSSQWYDAARAVLHLAPAPDPPPPRATEEELDMWREQRRQRYRDRRTLAVVKSNYGPLGWERTLGRRSPSGGERAGQYAGWAWPRPPAGEEPGWWAR